MKNLTKDTEKASTCHDVKLLCTIFTCHFSLHSCAGVSFKAPALNFQFVLIHNYLAFFAITGNHKNAVI